MSRPGMSRSYSGRSFRSYSDNYSVYSSQLESEDGDGDASLYDRSVYDNHRSSYARSRSAYSLSSYYDTDDYDDAYSRDDVSYAQSYYGRGGGGRGGGGDGDDISYAQSYYDNRSYADGRSYADDDYSYAGRSYGGPATKSLRRSTYEYSRADDIDNRPGLMAQESWRSGAQLQDYVERFSEMDGDYDDGDGTGADGSVDDQAPPPTLYDLFFDLPHPAASPGCPRARVIDSPSVMSVTGVNNAHAEATDAAARAVMDELFDPSNISRIARFAFPEHDDELHAAEIAEQQQKQQLQQQMASSGRSTLTGMASRTDSAYDTSDANSYDEAYTVLSASAVPSSANLNRYDMYLKSFRPQCHTFTLQLADGTRIHGHVRRYLPTHAHSEGRSDVGRRGARAMVLLTRATGGERFYSALLKTAEALYMERDGVDTTLAPDEVPARTFLHALHNHHSQLTLEAREIVARGGTLNYSVGGEDQNAAESAKTFMAQNERLFCIALSGLEFGGYGSLDDMDPQTGQLGRLVVSGDAVRLRLPPSLQPGYEATHTCTVEDLHSPILPLLRCLGAPHTLRLLSALLCENRIILVSRSASKLSTCVRAASALLAQGLLVWRHVQIPVLPPHLLKYLTSDSPYLIGLLEQFASNLDVLPMMQSVLCVNLDWNELRTYNMPNAAASIPDLLKPVRRGRTADDVFSPAEFLAKDMADVLKNDRSVWGGITGGRTGGAPNVGPSPNEVSFSGTVSDDGGTASNQSGKTSVRPKNTFMSKMTPLTGMLGIKKKDDGQNGVANGSANEEQKTADMAAFMGSVMRKARNPALKNQTNIPGARWGNFRGGEDFDDMSSVGEDMSINGDRTMMTVPQNDRALEKDVGLLPGFFAVEAEGSCENERAEEEIRAAFTCFYLYIFGDMGMYLSEAEDGSLWLDRKKFLLRKKQMGDRESSPMFAVCLSLSRSLMFESFVRGRIADLERPTAERAKMMPHHIPLFVYCEKYLRINRLKFTMANIRRVVSTTILSCPQHIIVDETEAIRAKALALTSNEPFKGNVVMAVESLVSECREVNYALPQVIAVIWARMAETRAAYWRHPLLALHLLKNLVLHGPLTAIAEATDGIEKVRALQSFTSKNTASAREVQIVAKQVFALLTDRTRLFFKRRRAGIERTYHPNATMNTLRFSDYLVRRLPLTSGFRNMHVLMRPTEAGLPSAASSQAKEGGASVVTGLLSVDRLPDEMDRETMGHQGQSGPVYETEEQKYQMETEPLDYNNQLPDPYDDDDYDTLAFGVEDKMGVRGPSDEATQMISILEGMSKLGGPASNSSHDDLNRPNYVEEEDGDEEKVEDEAGYGETEGRQQTLVDEPAGDNHNEEHGEDEANGNSEEDAAALRALRDLGYGEGHQEIVESGIEIEGLTPPDSIVDTPKGIDEEIGISGPSIETVGVDGGEEGQGNKDEEVNPKENGHDASLPDGEEGPTATASTGTGQKKKRKKKKKKKPNS